jgi:arabinose-5-phosphate isomerase
LKTQKEIIQSAISTIETEALAINKLKSYIDENFAKCVHQILFCKGRVVITGIGKSAIIGTKIVATLNSTGTPALFMHAADAIHGDLGMVQKDDIVICISNSGNTPEIKVLIPMLKTLGACLIAMVGNMNSDLAVQADFVINARVENEVTPGNPIPTASTTAQMVMGDALAVALLECRGFTVDDFARYHPGGSLGKKMYLKAENLYSKNQKPEVDINDSIQEVIIEISARRLGAAAVTNNGKLEGIITDGDLRRMLQRNIDINELKASDILTVNPKTISPSTLAVEALQIMRQNNITQLVVVEDGTYLGIVHLHDILHEGII